MACTLGVRRASQSVRVRSAGAAAPMCPHEAGDGEPREAQKHRGKDVEPVCGRGAYRGGRRGSHAPQAGGEKHSDQRKEAARKFQPQHARDAAERTQRRASSLSRSGTNLPGGGAGGFGLRTARRGHDLWPGCGCSGRTGSRAWVRRGGSVGGFPQGAGGRACAFAESSSEAHLVHRAPSVTVCKRIRGSGHPTMPERTGQSPPGDPKGAGKESMKTVIWTIGGVCAAVAGMLVWSRRSQQQAVTELAHRLEEAWADHHTVA